MRMLFEDMLPEPLSVATWIEKSLTTGGRPAGSARFSSRTAVDMLLLVSFVAGHGPRAAMISERFRREAVMLQADRIARRRKMMQSNLAARRGAASARIRLSIALRRVVPAAAGVLALALPLAGATRRPIRFEELATIPRVAGVAVSPDGRLAAYTGSTPDVAANTSRSAVWSVPIGGEAAGRNGVGGEARRVTSGENDSDARFSPDGQTL